MQDPGDHVPGFPDNETAAAGHRLSAAVGDLLRRRGESLALAESCTGGLVGAVMTAPPGASDYLWGSAVVYSASAKLSMLDVAEATLDEHGTVSPETTAALAKGVKALSGATYGLAVTGWAGPGGGTDADPVGTVYVALALADDVEIRRYSFDGDRDEVRSRALLASLEWLRGELAERGRPAAEPAGRTPGREEYGG